MAPTLAEIKLIQLKNCFVSVPQSVVTVLDNARAVCDIESALLSIH